MGNREDSGVSSGGLAVKHLAPSAKSHRFDPSNRSKFLEINFSTHNIVGG